MASLVVLCSAYAQILASSFCRVEEKNGISLWFTMNGVNHQAQYPTPAATPMAALRQSISQLLLFRELIMLLLQYKIFLGNCYFGASKLTYCNIMPMFCVELLLSYSRPSFFFCGPVLSVYIDNFAKLQQHIENSSICLHIE